MAPTAKELMAKLIQDKEYLSLKKERDEQRLRDQKLFATDQAELLEELKSIGWDVGTVWDFVNMKGNAYPEAIPILKSHLKKEHHPRIMDGIVRSLCLVDLQADDEMWETLVTMYESTPSDSSISDPLQKGLQQGIAFTLIKLSTKKRLSDLSELIKRVPQGDCIQELKKVVM